MPSVDLSVFYTKRKLSQIHLVHCSTLHYVSRHGLILYAVKYKPEFTTQSGMQVCSV